MQLYAFDVLALGGEDLHQLPLTMRKTNRAQLLRGRPDGMFVAPLEPGGTGPDLFGAACRMGLEGLVSKRRDRRYGAGRSKDWIKVKNRTHPADDAGNGGVQSVVERTSLSGPGARGPAADDLVWPSPNTLFRQKYWCTAFR